MGNAMFKTTARRPGVRAARPTRKADRQPVTRSASLWFGDATTPRSCTIRDVSTGGARVSVVSSGTLPDEILLTCRGEDLAALATVRWRSNCEMGLRFSRRGTMADEPALRKLLLARQPKTASHDAGQRSAPPPAQNDERKRIDNMWRTLGLDPQGTHSQGALKDAYRNLARKHHPDLGGDVMAFQRIAVAYETLSREATITAR